jgi:virginiamycin B lyase
MRRIDRVTLLVALVAMACPAFMGKAEAAVGRGIEFHLGSGMYASALTLGPDGNLWFAGTRRGSQSPVDVVGRVTPSGDIAEFPLPPHPDAQLGISSIVSGADRNLYFTEPNGNRTGQVSLTGQIHEAPLPVPGSRPRTIAMAPDGSLWITEEGTDKVGRIDLAKGVLQERSLEAGARPTGIAARADGTIWIAEPGLDQIAEVPATGPMISFPIPFASSRPNAILPGPEGDVWLTEEGGPWLGRITAAAGAVKGKYVRLRLSSLTRGTRWLAFGPYGDFWFTSGNHIGSISANLLLGEMACVPGGCGLPVTALAASREGDLWYATGPREAGIGEASSAGGTIGRFQPPRIAAAIDRHAGRLAGRYVKIGVLCLGGAAGQLCRGQVRIHSRGRGSAVLGSRGLELHVQAKRRFRVRLSRAAAQLLRREGELTVQVAVTLSSGGHTTRRLVLRANGSAKGPARG